MRRFSRMAAMAVALSASLLPAPVHGARTDLPAWNQAWNITQKAYAEAQAKYQTNRDSAELAWEFGRACFDLAEFALEKRDRANLAQQGISACERSIQLQSNSAPAHYYLGMNLGQLARTKGFTALKTISPMRREFENALALDAKYDHAGPDRNLGYFYRDAPAWAGIGDKTKARGHLTHAVELAPDFPENRLALIEGYLNWGEREAAAREMAELEKILPAARAKLTGPIWEVTWYDWDELLTKLKKKLTK